jgi:8-hydroxy-5-deazaflavin:NADPH oxidoreductase
VKGIIGMNFGIIGSGAVGQTIGTKLIELGHPVKIGSRDPAKLQEWQNKGGSGASTGSFAEAAEFGEIIFNCTLGTGAIEAVTLAGEANLNGKILVDTSNPLDFSKGFPPSLTVCNTDSLGEQIQRIFPNVRLVKALNTMTANLMVDPALVPGDHDAFICGNDATAKETVKQILEQFGWKSIIDLGDISAARTTEMLMPFWLRLYGAFQSPIFNYKIVR